MDEVCTDNRFELIEKFKKELIKSTNIETSPEEMNVLDNILFRFWQMGWLESIDRMLLVKESAKTLMHSVGNSVSAKAFRNAGRFMQNAIDAEAPEFEFVQASSEIPNNSDTISRQAAIDAICKTCSIEEDYHNCVGYKENSTWCDELVVLRALPSAQPEITLESAIDYLHSIGWMQEHDRIMVESAQPEVIRCEDCAAYGEMLTGRDARMICHKFALNFPRDFYCADAERRTDG